MKIMPIKDKVLDAELKEEERKAYEQEYERLAKVRRDEELKKARTRGKDKANGKNPVLSFFSKILSHIEIKDH